MFPSVRTPLRSEALIEYCMRSGVFWAPLIYLTEVPLTAHFAHAQRCMQIKNTDKKC
jgi:hypothetical protein